MKAVASILVAGLALVLSPGAQAQLRIGAVLSVTGPGASLGIPEKNTIALMPQEIAGLRVEYLMLDDASD